MPLDIATKLAACRNYTEARPMLEFLGASKSSHELMQLYYAQPENSPYRTRFFDTVIQEMEDGIDSKKVKPEGLDPGKIIEQNGENGKNGEKKLKEYEITGSLSSTGSSGEAPAHEGDNKPTTVGDSSVQPTENQLKEQMPGMPGMPQVPGMPPATQQMGMPGVPPELQHQMEQAMTKMPAMNPMQQMRYTQEMVKNMVTPLYQNLAGIKEAITKLDSKIQETQAKSIPLNIPGGENLVMPQGPLREIAPTGYEGIPGFANGAQPPPPRKDIAAKRQLIIEKDRILRTTKNHKDVSQMYS